MLQLYHTRSRVPPTMHLRPRPTAAHWLLARLPSGSQDDQGITERKKSKPAVTKAKKEGASPDAEPFKIVKREEVSW